ncbi:MAG: Serine/threonine-protein kinase PrkC [bacterium]|nr:Serine/threonine-protein kinase PrkC [bacterium]
MTDTDKWMNQRLNSFGVKYRLGQGAFATVYAAEDLSAKGDTKKLVALKVPLNERANIRKSLAEAELLYELDHPGIVKVHAIEFERSSNIPFFVMELIEGKPMEEILDLNQAPLSPRLAKHLMIQLLEALVYLEKQGILHRDVKPANILMTQDFTIKLTDFGFAIRKDELTARNAHAGTLYYMAPEQLDGQPDFASDRWAAGVMAYFMCTAKLPFLATTEDELRRKIKEDEPTPITDLNPNADPELVTLVNSLLQKDPVQRVITPLTPVK